MGKGAHRPSKRDWPRYAHVLDLRLAGLTLALIGEIKGVTRERIRQMVLVAKHRLAYRVFKGIPSRLLEKKRPVNEHNLKPR